jgi:hypothetical protein
MWETFWEIEKARFVLGIVVLLGVGAVSFVLTLSRHPR